MNLWLLPKGDQRAYRGRTGAVEAGIKEGKLRAAGIEWKPALMALLVFSLFMAAAQKPTAPAPPATATSDLAIVQLPKLWRSETTKHDFRVEVTKDLFRAEWVNLPSAAAKQGAYIHTECRRAGSKWVGRSSINMLFNIPGAPAGKDTKMCSLTMRFEVDSISPEKITGHAETLHSFDVNSCRVDQTSWGEFTWVPKK
jgi:hypothetical protein